MSHWEGRINEPHPSKCPPKKQFQYLSLKLEFFPKVTISYVTQIHRSHLEKSKKKVNGSFVRQMSGPLAWSSFFSHLRSNIRGWIWRPTIRASVSRSTFLLISLRGELQIRSETHLQLRRGWRSSGEIWLKKSRINQGIVGCTPTNIPLWEIPI